MAASRSRTGGALEAAAEPRTFLEALDEVSDAVESGAGLPAVARAAGRALDASVIVLDSASSVVAVWVLANGCTTMREIPRTDYTRIPEGKNVRVETRDARLRCHILAERHHVLPDLGM